MLLCAGLLLAAALGSRTQAQPNLRLPQVPQDSAVRIGRLPNGLTYYIRHNALPEQRADFYIVQKVGSVQEEESQRGLAHFLEHMCFNGTQHFPDDALIKYLESIGVKFGVNLNAATSTDYTIYNIDNVPVSRTSVVDSCLLILHDWSDGLTLDPKEIDKERGVIREEWRMRSNAFMRIYERNLERLYPGSRYARRFPIGLIDEVIMKFKPETLRAYYEKWYRPDLQGIIVVGDVDVDRTEQAIRTLFSPIRMPENPAAYEHYPVPDNTEPIYIVDKDKELQQPTIDLLLKRDVLPDSLRGTVAELTTDVLQHLALSMLNARLNEKGQAPDCPYISAGSAYMPYLISKTKDAFMLEFAPKAGQDAAAMQAVAEELLRARQYGFTATELTRAKQDMLSQTEALYNNRDKQYNHFYVQQYVDHFLSGYAIPSIETYTALIQQLMQNIPLEYVNLYYRQALTGRTDTNLVVLATYPEKEGLTIPAPDVLRSAFEAAAQAKLEPYVDNVKQEPLLPHQPKPGKIVKEEKAPLGYTCWTLSNGARVYYRVTDFNKSAINMRAVSMGGLNYFSNDDLSNARLFNTVIAANGWGNFSATELEKALAGKMVSLQAQLGLHTDNLSGSCTPRDLRTLMELTYLHFSAPYDDRDAYARTLTALRAALDNKAMVPEQAFSDSLSNVINKHNPLSASIETVDLDRASYDRIRQLYTERFQSAGDFDFFFTGAIPVDTLRTLVETYLASTPNVGKRETLRRMNYPTPRGTVNNRFSRKMETPKAIMAQVWMGQAESSVKNKITAQIAASALTERYLKSIREDRGYAYSVEADAMLNDVYNDYTLLVLCPFIPEKCDSILLLISHDIHALAEHGVTPDELQKAKEYQQKVYADNQKSNHYWNSAIENLIIWGRDEHTPYLRTLQDITPADVSRFIKQHVLKNGQCTNVIMLPQAQ